MEHHNIMQRIMKFMFSKIKKKQTHDRTNEFFTVPVILFLCIKATTGENEKSN